MIKNINNQSDYFFPEMPKRITHYGFGIMVLLLIGFLSAASFIEYSDNQQFEIIVAKGSQTARLDFTVYRRLKNEQSFMATGPFQQPIQGYLQKKIVLARDNYVIVPVVFSDTSLSKLPIDGSVKLHGSFRVSKGSLLGNIIKTN